MYEKRSYMSSTRSTDDFQLKSSMFHHNDGLWISGKYSSFYLKAAAQMVNLTLPPATHQSESSPRIEDYE